MDRALVEEITRLILSKLEHEPDYLPLSKEELKAWDRMSASINETKTEQAFIKTNYDYSPLTEKELEEWGQLTLTGEDRATEGKAKFFRHN